MDSLGGTRGTFHKNLTRRKHNGGSRDRTSPLTTLLSFSRGCDTLSLGGGGLGGHGSRGSPVRVQMAGGPGGTWGVFPFGECLRFPGVRVFLGKRLRVTL